MLECPVCKKQISTIYKRFNADESSRCGNCWEEYDIQEKIKSYGGDRLAYVFGMQKMLHERIIKDNKRYPTTTEEQINVLMTALIHEAVELQRLTNYKWWKNPNKDFPVRLAKEELIDIFHFWLDAANELGMTPQSIVEEYEKKNRINNKRQDDGY